MSTVAITLTVTIPLTLILLALGLAGLFYSMKHKKLCWKVKKITPIAVDLVVEESIT